MMSRTVDINDEWENYINSNEKVLPHPRDIFLNGAFAVYKMVITAEDDQNKLRQVMFSLGEQFRKEYAK